MIDKLELEDADGTKLSVMRHHDGGVTFMVLDRPNATRCVGDVFGIEGATKADLQRLIDFLESCK